MNSLRIITVGILSLALAIPVSAFETCRCTTTKKTSACRCVPPQAEACCCQSAADAIPCCVQTNSDNCESQCNCSVDVASAVVTERSKNNDDFVTFAIVPFTDGYLFPTVRSTLQTCLDRPPISHNRRQATLCVWLK